MASAEIDDPYRKELLQALKDVLAIETLSSTTWAFLWLSDIERLEKLVARAQEEPEGLRLEFMALEFMKIAQRRNQRKRTQSTASTPLQGSPRGQKRNSSGQPVITLSKPQRDLASQRDGKKCILTKAGEPTEIVHIYPFSMRNENNDSPRRGPSFWGTLKLFWSPKRVDDWHNAIFSTPAATEICQNLLCLSPTAHAYWERAYFALKPIRVSEDEKCLYVQFFWLPSTPHVPQVSILQPPSLSALDQGPNLAKLWDHETDRKICSGDEVSFQTDDPALRPLPDIRLLEMQWFLHRLTAISGAAKTQDDFHDDDDDDDDDSDDNVATRLQAALEAQWDLYGEDDWDTETEGMPERFREPHSTAQPFATQSFGAIGSSMWPQSIVTKKEEEKMTMR